MHSTIAKLMKGPKHNSTGYKNLVDARPATNKRTIKKHHHRAVWSAAQVRYKEDYLASLAQAGIPVCQLAVDDKAKTPIWIPVSQHLKPMSFFMSSNAWKTLDHNFPVSERMLITCAGVMERSALAPPMRMPQWR